MSASKRLEYLLDQAETEITSRLTVVLNKQRREQHKRDYEARIQSLLLKAQAEINTLTLKSVNEVLREYQDTLERYVKDTVNGNMTGGEMSRAHKSLLKRLAPQAYTEGMREGGVRDPESEMEDEDDSTIEDWISEQATYTLEFAKTCEEVSELTGDDQTNKRNVLLDRVDDWVASLRYLGQRGYLSAKGNLPLTFEGDDGKESCSTCDRLKGQRHRRSWWEKRSLLDRPNDNYECGRFNCEHHFVSDDGDVVVD